MTLPPPLPIPAKRIHRGSVWQLVLGSISVLSFLGLASLFFAMAWNYKSNGGLVSLDSQMVELTAWALLCLALLSIPSIILPIRRLNGIEPALISIGKNALWIIAGSLALWIGLIFLGNTIGVPDDIPLFVVGLLNILVITLPVAAWVLIGARRLRIHSAQRAWGSFNFSQSITPSVAITLELLGFFVVLVALGAWLMQQAEFIPYLTLLESQGTLSEQNIESMVYDLLPLFDPSTLYIGGIFLLCVFIPMIEEMFKPLAIWVFAGKKLTPSEGFFIGLVAGAGFGLAESLLMMAMAGDQWTSTVIGRAGTSLLHITTTAILGWALAKTWQDAKYIRVSLTYLTMIVLHGIWNLFAVLMGLNSLIFPIEYDWVGSLMPIAKWVLGGLAAVMVVALVLINRKLQKESIPPLLPGTISSPES